MPNDNDNNDNNDNDISKLLRKYYKPKDDITPEQFWDELSKKIDCLFHREVFTEKACNENGALFTDEEKYWMGLDEYVRNEVSSLKHKTITDHLLTCKDCRKNYNDLLDKKKVLENLLIYSASSRSQLVNSLI